MAEDMTPEAAQTTDPKHNAGVRHSMIRKLVSNLRPHEEKIASEKEEIKSLRKIFTNDTGITMADFDAARRLAEIEDDDERHGKLDNLQECYNALMPGEQLTWLGADEDDAEPEPDANE